MRHFRMRMYCKVVAVGIRPADQNKREDHPIGVIPIDSIYTPVSRVNLPSRKYSCRTSG